MVELAVIGAVSSLFNAALKAATNQDGVVGEVVGGRADSLLVGGWKGAGYALGCLHKNWKRLEPQENHILYRAMLMAHWRAVQQTAQQFGHRCGMDLNCVTDALPLPLPLPQLPSWRPSTTLGLFSQVDEQALRDLVTLCDARFKAIERGEPIEVPANWSAMLDTAYNDLTSLSQQALDPGQGPAGRAWAALERDLGLMPALDGFKEFFHAFWYESFGVNFQILTRAPDVAPLLMGKLFQEIRVREEARALNPQTILHALTAALQPVRGDIAEHRQENKRDFAELKELLRESLRQPRRSEPEPLIGLANIHARILARDAEADQLLAALKQPGPRIVSIAAPPGFGKSALFAHAFSRAMPGGEPAEAGLAGVVVLDARAVVPGFSTVAGLLGRMSGRQETASRFQDFTAAAQTQQAERQDLFFDFLRACGPMWLLIENAENAILPEATSEFRSLLQGWCAKEHQAKLLLLSRHPLNVTPPCHHRLSTVERALQAGLPMEEAVEVLRSGLADTDRHRDIATPLLEAIAGRVYRIPLALVQFAGYLRADETLRVDRPFIEQSDLLRLFDPDHMEASIARVVEEHLKLLDAASLRLLHILAWAGGAVPENGLLAAADAGESGGRTLTRLRRAGLVNIIAGPPAEGASFTIHGLVRDVVMRSAQGEFPLSEWAHALGAVAVLEARSAKHRPAEMLYSLSERALRKLVDREGAGDLAAQLAGRVMNRGVSLDDLGRLEDAVAAYDSAIAIYRPLLEQAGGPEFMQALAGALMNKCVSLTTLGRLEDATGACDEATAMFRLLLEQHGGAERSKDLAAALMNRGVAFMALGRLQEATAAFDKAIGLFRDRVEQDGGFVSLNGLASALANRGMVLSSLGRSEDAVAAYQEAIPIRLGLIKAGHRELERELAKDLVSAGNAEGRLGRFESAIKAFVVAIAILRQWVEQEGRSELASDLARALLNYGVPLKNLGRLDDAIAAYDESVAIFGRLMERECRLEVANELAAALINRANALGITGRLEEALAASGRAAAILRRLMEQEGRAELATDLAAALVSQGNVLWDQSKPEEALAAYEESIVIRRHLVEKQGRLELTNDLANSVMSKGNALGGLGRFEAAIAAYDEAIAIRRRLVEQEGRLDLLNDLAGALGNRGTALHQLGRIDDAIAAYEEAIGIQKGLMQQEAPGGLADDLARTLYNMAQAKGKTQEGCEAIKEARVLFESLVQTGWHHLQTKLRYARAVEADLCNGQGGESK